MISKIKCLRNFFESNYFTEYVLKANQFKASAIPRAPQIAAFPTMGGPEAPRSSIRIYTDQGL